MGDCNDLVDLTAYGTDGEQALEKALKMQFRDAAHLRCFIHFRRNLERKLREIGVSRKGKRSLFADVFGSRKDCTFDKESDLSDEDLEPKCETKGLADASDEDEFDDMLAQLSDKCNALEKECTHKPPVFYKWFCQYKAPEMKQSMLASLRAAMGLGNPPAWYTTNRNESINAVIHGKNHYTAMNWPDFCEAVKGKVDDQRKEIEFALTGRGEYRVCDEFSHFVVAERDWWQMTPSQRQRKVAQFFNATKPPQGRVRHQLYRQQSQSADEIPNNAESSQHIASGIATSQISGLSLPYRSTGITTVSAEHLAHMWKKAEALLLSEGSVVLSPGETSAFLVASASTPGNPHRVTVHQGGRCVCNCIGYSSSKICAHALVVAESNNSPFDFVAWYKRSKHSPSAGSLSDLAKPKHTGRKGNAMESSSPVIASTNLSRSSVAKLPGPPPLSFPPGYPHSISRLPQLVHSPSLNAVPRAPQLVHSPSLNTIARLPQPPPLVHVARSDPYYPGVPMPSATTSSAHIGQAALSMADPYNPPVSQSMQAYFPQQAFQSQFSSFTVITPPPGPVTDPVSRTDVFAVVFLNNRVKKCYGCSRDFSRRYDGQLLPPPHDLIIQHEDRREFLRGGKKCYSPRPQNTYFHPSVSCIRSKCPYFTATLLCLDKVRNQLTSEHIDYLQNHFGIQL